MLRAVLAVERADGGDRRDGNPQETLVPEGDYQVAYMRYETGFVYDRTVWFVRCEIIDEGPHFGAPLLRYYNEPRRDRPLPRSHNLALDYLALAGRRPPRKLKPDQLLSGCIVLARVVTVREQRKGRRPTLLPEGAHYSKIDAFLRITTGCPPCMRPASL